MKEFIEFIVKRIVDNPDKVIVEETMPDEHTIKLTLKVDESDMGKVIGKKGNNINSIRTLINALGGKGKHKAIVEIIE